MTRVEIILELLKENHKNTPTIFFPSNNLFKREIAPTNIIVMLKTFGEAENGAEAASVPPRVSC